jgi:DNA-binding response OmpR family regulator
MRILIIEDNKAIAQNEQRFLQTQWWEVDIVHDGKEWCERALHFAYDLFIIDWMLPSMDGVEIMAEIRKKKRTPIIMTTAKWQLEDKGGGFDAWADDYLVKPFALEELVMRIQAIAKRTEIASVLRIWDIEMLLDEQRVMKNGVEIKLPLKEYLLIEYLAQRQWQAISRTDLIEYIRWGEAWENDAALDVYIANVRKKLGKTVIETIKGFGYRVD